jgi:2,4-didehydro-3-deoxy-L-rhamnonate hydrolase
MRLYTYHYSGETRVGAERDGRLVPLPYPDMLDLIAAGPAGLATAREALDSPGTGVPLAEVRLLAPIPRPGKILCSGVNYKGHLEENPGAVLPETPGFFAKLPSAVIGPGAPIVHPRMTEQLDYEVELAVVIGRRIRRAPEAEAIAAACGYTLLHDVSARDVQFKQPVNNQITLGKNFDTFAPLGPCIVTADVLPHPETIRLRTLVNGRVMQDGSNADWVFALPYLLSFLSHVMTLEPGDIVTTGTPAGVGVFRKPPVFLRPGDVVAIEGEGIGRLENPVVAEEPL